jgi:hypothetical protein
LRPIRRVCEANPRAQKNVAEQNTTKGASPTGVLCSLAAYRRRTLTALLCAVGFVLYFNYSFYLYHFFYIIFYNGLKTSRKTLK